MINITIIGMGLIGTSLGMALRSAPASESALGAVHITGYDPDSNATSTARGRLAIDRIARSLPEAIQGAQIIVIATPVQAIQAIFTQFAPLLPPGTIVTDTASTKAQVCAWAAALLPPTVDFVGGHPMAGKEQSGPTAADPDLFRGAIYCLTPAANARPQAVAACETLAITAGARPYYIDPEEHDAYVAGISHLPLLLATALVEVTSNGPGWAEMARLAATGFRDVSRLASGDPTMRRDICITNRVALTRWIDDTISLLADIRTALEQGDAAWLHDLFQRTKQARDAWLEQQPHLRPGEEPLDPMQYVERRSLFGFGKPRREKE